MHFERFLTPVCVQFEVHELRKKKGIDVDDTPIPMNETLASQESSDVTTGDSDTKNESKEESKSGCQDAKCKED